MQLPTPTPYAFGTSQYVMEVETSNWRIWSVTDDAINVWNYEPSIGVVIQTAIIIILVVVFIMLLIKELQNIQNGE